MGEDKESVRQQIKDSMSLLEKLSALKLWWWAQREAKPMLSRMFGNKITTGIGVTIALWATLSATGIIPPQYALMGNSVVGFLAALGFVAAKDATTGSPPGANS